MASRFPSITNGASTLSYQTVISHCRWVDKWNSVQGSSQWHLASDPICSAPFHTSSLYELTSESGHDLNGPAPTDNKSSGAVVIWHCHSHPLAPRQCKYSGWSALTTRADWWLHVCGVHPWLLNWHLFYLLELLIIIPHVMSSFPNIWCPGPWMHQRRKQCREWVRMGQSEKLMFSIYNIGSASWGYAIQFIGRGKHKFTNHTWCICIPYGNGKENP